MELRKANADNKTKKPVISMVMYISASIVALLAVSALINNIILFKSNLAMYVEQGYSSGIVLKQLIPSMLLPGIFEPIAVYGGIALILLGAGLINQNISKCLILLTQAEHSNNTAQDGTLTDNVVEAEAEVENNEEANQDVSEKLPTAVEATDVLKNIAS